MRIEHHGYTDLIPMAFGRTPFTPFPSDLFLSDLLRSLIDPKRDRHS